VEAGCGGTADATPASSGPPASLCVSVTGADGLLGTLVAVSLAARPSWSADPAPWLAPATDLVAGALARKRTSQESLSRLHALAHATRAVTVGALGASIAHELAQPLMAIASNAQAGLRLAAGPAGDAATLREIFGDIAGDARRASEIVHRTRGLLRRSEPQRVLVDLGDVARDTARLTADEALRRRVAVRLELAAERLPIEGDPVQLQQVTLNLVLNGFDAMDAVPPAERQLVLGTGRDGDGGVELVVVDRGIGVEDHRLERIFDPFHSTKSAGLGMGLYVSRAIVEAHGGSITAAGGEGRGLAVRVRLPLAAQDAPHASGTKIRSTHPPRAAR
jgi:signal transduction histidine kinase